ncbi:hypothetical protein TNCV_1142601 [Trichonephila clavipes]|nr:hypothetical protein TNCV_1142601 [Trichonephila clavipes]
MLARSQPYGCYWKLLKKSTNITINGVDGFFEKIRADYKQGISHRNLKALLQWALDQILNGYRSQACSINERQRNSHADIIVWVKISVSGRTNLSYNTESSLLRCNP